MAELTTCFIEANSANTEFVLKAINEIVNSVCLSACGIFSLHLVNLKENAIKFLIKRKKVVKTSTVWRLVHLLNWRTAKENLICGGHFRMPIILLMFL